MCTCKYSAAQLLRSWPMQSNIQKFEVLSRSWEVLDHVAIAWLLEFQCKHFVCSNTITIKLQFHLSFFLTMVNYSQSDLNLAVEIKSNTMIKVILEWMYSGKVWIHSRTEWIYSELEWKHSVSVLEFGEIKTTKKSEIFQGVRIWKNFVENSNF